MWIERVRGVAGAPEPDLFPVARERARTKQQHESDNRGHSEAREHPQSRTILPQQAGSPDIDGFGVTLQPDSERDPAGERSSAPRIPDGRQVRRNQQRIRRQREHGSRNIKRKAERNNARGEPSLSFAPNVSSKPERQPRDEEQVENGQQPQWQTRLRAA